MATANSISKFENSLREFLINVMSDKYGDAKSYAYRYNNLKVFMDPKRCSDPHFFVSIGISEANFSILDGKKLDLDEFDMVGELNRISGVDVPKPLQSLKDKAIRFDNVCDKENMSEMVFKLLKL